MIDFIETLLAICGGISIIGGAIAVVWKLIRPATQMVDRVETLERHDKESYKHTEEIEKSLENVKNTQKETLRCLVSMLNHEITGNGVDEMKKIRDELTDLIAK